MQIMIRYDNFSADCYNLQIDDAVLGFEGETSTLSLPYTEIEDFCITQNRRGKAYFSVLSADRMIEGQILEPEEIDPFVAELKKKMDGIINIEVRK